MSTTVQGLRERITANGRAWHLTDDKEKRRALHEDNVALYKQLDALTGSTSTYNEQTGVWSTSQPGTADYQAAALPQASDLSQEVSALQKSATEKTRSSLARAKNQAKSALDAQEATIGEVYQSARNQSAAQSEIARKNLSEQAAQAGLNTGAAGQVALAQNVAAQGELSAIDAQETQAKTALSQARQEMERDYAFAVAEAQAEGDYALAKALYDEALRYDEAQRKTAQSQEELAQKVYKLAQANRQQEAEDEERGYQRGQDEAQWKKELEEQQREEAVKLAQSRAAFGDFQGYAQLGYSQAEIDRMTQLWRYYQFIR